MVFAARQRVQRCASFQVWEGSSGSYMDIQAQGKGQTLQYYLVDSHY